MCRDTTDDIIIVCNLVVDNRRDVGLAREFPVYAASVNTELIREERKKSSTSTSVVTVAVAHAHPNGVRSIRVASFTSLRIPVGEVVKRIHLALAASFAFRSTRATLRKITHRRLITVSWI